jgi:hypothetical protein
MPEPLNSSRVGTRHDASEAGCLRRPSEYGPHFVQLLREEFEGVGHLKMPSSRDARIPPGSARTRGDWRALPGPIAGWRKRALWVIHKLKAAPKAIRLLVIAAGALAVFCATNLVYQVLRKPAEVFSPVSGTLNKTPLETWRRYGPLFREYSTAAISPELLAALAQVEGAGNPVATTYWRWRLTWNPLAIYQPASSSVGMFQMTDAAFTEARDHCIRHHTVVEDGCSFTLLNSRVFPSRAIELTAVFLDRKVTAVLAHRPKMAASARQKQELAAVIHLCGAGPANAFASRGFHLIAGKRCGDHDVAVYLAQVDAMKREFRRFAAEG